MRQKSQRPCRHCGWNGTVCSLCGGTAHPELDLCGCGRLVCTECTDRADHAVHHPGEASFQRATEPAEPLPVN